MAASRTAKKGAKENPIGDVSGCMVTSYATTLKRSGRQPTVQDVYYKALEILGMVPDDFP